MMKSVVALVPLKLNSRRLPNKNFLRLGNRPLAYHIFNTLSEVKKIQRIHCYTSQQQVLALLPDCVELLMRPRSLDGDHVKANELFRYAVENIDAEIIVLCHATGPFVLERSITEGIDAVLSGEYDCAFSAKRQQTYCWYKDQPLNYNPDNMSQTQDLTPVFTETSGFYVFKKADYLNNGTRIGKNPFMVEVDFKEAVDIDDPADFALASLLIDYDPSQAIYTKDNFFVELANNCIQYKNIQHLSFDLDGVLINSLGVMEAAWSEAMREVGENINFSEYKKHIGIPFNNILDNIGCKKNNYSEIARIYNASARRNLDKIEVYDGVIQSIIRAKEAGLKVSIVTSKNRERTIELVESLLSGAQFDSVVTPDDITTGRGKPNPDPLLLACLEVGVDPHKTIYVGDMDADREASRRAGIHFVHASWGFSDLTDVKDIWFNNCKDMMDFILE
jgi:HAD superfamily hydrolase (TIGR01549 family)